MDLISRQAVLNLKQTFTDNAGYETEYVDVEDIKELPAITFVNNKGKWVTDETSGSALNDRYYCSKCGHKLKMDYTLIKAYQETGKLLFCEHCGTDMRDGVKSFYDRMTEELGEDWDMPADMSEVNE